MSMIQNSKNFPQIRQVKAKSQLETIAPQLAAVYAQAFPDRQDLTAWATDAFLTYFQRNTCFIAEDTQSIVGFILSEIVSDQAEILTFCVLPEWQKKGLGTVLLKKLLIHIEHTAVKRIFLDVSEVNTTAIRLYQKHDFQTVGRRPAYYQIRGKQPQAALVLQRRQKTLVS